MSAADCTTAGVSDELLARLGPAGLTGRPIVTSRIAGTATIYRAGDRIVMHPDTLDRLRHALFLREIRDVVFYGLTRAFPDLEVARR